MTSMARTRAAALSLALLVGCPWSWDRTAYEVVLADGTYAVSDAGQPAAVQAITARVDRAAGLVTFTLADGTQLPLAFAPCPKAEWQGNCATMASYALNEVSDLTPAPLVLETLTFQTPLVFPLCSADRMILADDLNDQGLALVFDRVPGP